MAVASSALDRSREKLALTRLDDYSVVFVFGDEVAYWKPGSLLAESSAGVSSGLADPN